MKISFVYGVCARFDAISNAIVSEILWLSEIPGYEVRLFAQVCEVDEPSVTIVDSLAQVANDRFFQQSDLVIFHYGVYYPLFDLMHMVPISCRRLVVFHNITPEKLVHRDSRPLIRDSFRQMANIVFADTVFCDSAYNKSVLREHCIHTPAQVMSLALNSRVRAPSRKPSVYDGIVRVCFIGRFVASKGPLDLLRALELAAPDIKSRLQLDMLGNESFSDPQLLAEIKQRSLIINKRYGSQLQITLHGSLDEAGKCAVLQAADIFVLPTYHEGFCVPILEALASACQVLSYANSNVTAIGGDLSHLVPTGDCAALSEQLLELAATTVSESWQTQGYERYRSEVTDYVADFHPDVVKDRFIDAVNALLASDKNSTESYYAAS